MKEISQNKTGIFIAIIALIGLILRVFAFIDIPDLYGDEASLAFNLFDRSILEYFIPLNFGQAAPPLFLIFTKFFTLFIKNFEYSLRLIPFVSSILALFAFYFLSKKFFTKDISIAAAFTLFCLNIKLLAYSVVFKQYVSDVLIYILILLSYFYLDFDKKDKKFYGLLVFYALSIWFSFPAMFAFAGVFLLKFIQSKNIKNLLYAVPFIISFILFYIFEHHLNSSQMLHIYWTNGFINYNLSNFSTVLNSIIAWFFQFPVLKILFTVLFILGLAFALKDFKCEKNQLKVILFIIAVALSYLHIYPLFSRVSLYILPLLVIIGASFFEYIDYSSKFKKYAVLIFAFLIITASILPVLKNYIFKLNYIERIETVLGTSKSLMNNGDILYIPMESINTAKFYLREKPGVYNFKNVKFENMGDKDKISLDEYVKRLNSLESGHTYYYIFCHHTKKPQMLNKLYLWAKDKKDFKIYADNVTFDALIIFSL